MGKDHNLRAVIFDYGMVLSAPADTAAREALIQICGVDPRTFELHYWANRRAYDAGALVGETYWRKIADDIGISLNAEEIRELINHDVLMWTSLDHSMVGWARSIGQSGFRTGVLSNIGPELIAAMEKQFRWLDEFDHNIWSCRVGLVKPDPAIFNYALTQFGVPPEEVLFIDDREENVLSARTLGIRGIVFESLPRLHRELESLDISELLPPLLIPEFKQPTD